jgi:hypothetical protein
MKPIGKICTLVCSILLLNFFALAQGAATGDLRVTVKDPKGSLVTNATVTARDQEKATERTTNVNNDGVYRLLQLPPGTYTVIIESPGFAKTETPDITITVGGVADLPISLEVASGKEVVTVTSEADLIETTRTSTTATIEQRRIDNLPINGRNYINFALTDSQVLRDNAPSIGAAPTSGLNISGQRARSNLVNVDGADYIDNSTNGVRSTVSQEAVQEFQIVSNSYAAEYGRASGGVVNIITRSGSNDFHGDVYGYLRNRDFQATNPFSNVPNPAYTRVQAGAAFGGPIKKDKTYFYFSYEITRRHETGFSSIGQDGYGLTSTDASTAFGFPSGSGLLIQATPDQNTYFQNLQTALGTIQSTLGQPLATAYANEAALYATWVGGSSGVAVNGQYPASFAALPPTLVPAGLKQFPSSCSPGTANLTCNGLPSTFLSLSSQAGNYPIFEGTSLYSLRIDHNLTNTQRLMLRANVSPSTVTGIQVNGENQTFGQNAYSRTSQQTYRDWAIVGQHTWTIGNNKVNEFRFQYARRGLHYGFSSAPGGSDVASNITGFAFIGREPYTFIDRTEQRYQFTDNFSWTKGRHDIKFGADFNYIPVNATFTVNYGGVYNFGGLSGLFPNPCTPFLPPGSPNPCPNFPDFSPVQAYGLGIPTTYVQGVGNPKDSFSNKPLGIYIQDSWRFRPNLTFNYGLRYDVEFPPQLPPPNSFAQAAYNSLGLQKGINTDTNNIQPRIGLAWNPHGDGKTVVRASYGMFYDHPLLGLYFLGDASDGSTSGQLLFFGAGACDGTSPGNPANLNATNIFQGILGLNSCLPLANTAMGYQQNGNSQRFDPFFPNSLFINQNYITQGFPLFSQPFGYPQAKNFVYAYSQQVNFAIERDLGHNFALSLAYNFNGGRHLNRPINANPVRGDLMVENWQAAVAAATAAGIATTDPNFPNNPLTVGTANPAVFAPCGVSPTGVPYIPAALVNFFRPSGFNPSLMTAFAPCVPLARQVLSTAKLNASCNQTTLAGCVPFGDMDANYSNGSSAYSGFTANLRKRFSQHYEFLASYTWSHAIDDSTDLQSPLAPQDSFFPNLERSNSLFDQRHRFVFSGVYQSGRLAGDTFWRKFFSNWTVAPIVEVASGRPFQIITGENTNFQFEPSAARPNVVPQGAATNPCGPNVVSKYAHGQAFQLPCYVSGFDGTLLSLDGNLARNAGVKPWDVFNDLRIGKRVNITERISIDGIVDMFNLVNRFNVADVNPLWTNAGQPTAAYDPRQFQFALKVNW